jgi:hypothetical protein
MQVEWSVHSRDLNRVHPEFMTFNQAVIIPGASVCITAPVFILGLE